MFVIPVGSQTLDLSGFESFRAQYVTCISYLANVCLSYKSQSSTIRFYIISTRIAVTKKTDNNKGGYKRMWRLWDP